MLRRGRWLALAFLAVGCSSLLDLERFESSAGSGGASTGGGGGTGGAPLLGCENLTPWSLRLGYGADELEVQSLAITPDCGAVVVLRAVGSLGSLDEGFDDATFEPMGSAALRILRLESSGAVRWRRLIYSTQVGAVPQVGAGSLREGRDADGDVVWELAGWGYGDLHLDGGPTINISDARLGFLVRLYDDPATEDEARGSIQATVRGSSDEFIAVRTVDGGRELLTGTFSGMLTFEGALGPTLDAEVQSRQGFLAVLDEDPNAPGSIRARGFTTGGEVRVQSGFWSGDDLILVGDFFNTATFQQESLQNVAAGSPVTSRSPFVVRLTTSDENPTNWSGNSLAIDMTSGKGWVHDAVLDDDRLRVLLAFDGQPADANYPATTDGELVLVDYDVSDLTLQSVRRFQNTQSSIGLNFPTGGLVKPKMIQVAGETLMAGAFASTLNFGPSFSTSGPADRDGFLIGLDDTGMPGFTRVYRDPTGTEVVEAIAGRDRLVYAAVAFDGTQLDLGSNLLEPFPGAEGPNPGRYLLIDKIVLP